MSVSQKEYIEFLNKLSECPKAKNRVADMAEPIHWCLGIAGESGEVVDLIKKSVAYGRPLDKEKLRLEMGDLFNYFMRLAEWAGFSLSVIREGNVTKLTERFPDLLVQEYDIEGDQK